MIEMPQPLDARQNALPAEWTAHAEQIAETVHGAWRRQRTAAGWRCGPRRDEERKEDASLFDFDLLPQAEREYLLAIVQETLDAASGPGFQILPPSDTEAPAAGTTQPEPTTGSAGATGWNELMQDWRQIKAARECVTLGSARRIGEELLRLDQPVMAYDFTLSALQTDPRDVRLRQLQALALSRCGVPERANSVLRELRDEGHADDETLGLLARTYKDLWLRAVDQESREGNLHAAHELYLTAYRSTGGIYSGINAASTALWLGQRDEAANLAREVQSRCLADLEREGGATGDPYWLLATLGEACLVAGELAVAWHWYARAFAAAHGRFGDLHATRRQARLVLASLRLDPRSLDATLPMPRVALFCGPPNEPPGLGAACISPEAEASAAAAFQWMLLECGVGIGFATMASDADVLFFEALRERQGLAYAVLPGASDALGTEPNGAAAGAWRGRFEAALRGATQVLTAGEFGVPSDVTAFDYAQSVMYGLARLQADMLETGLIGFAVDEGNGLGRAAERWRQRGLEIKVFALPGLPSSTCSEGRAPAAISTTEPQPASKVVAILFADVTGSSKLNEAQVPLLFQHFMGLVAELLTSVPRPPLFRNTWGDRLCLVFESVRDAGQFALELCERAGGADWQQKGLPADLAIRVGLHAGPAWRCNDPVMEAPTFTGTHVSRAARIELIAPPGQVYASQAFAALAAAEGSRELSFEYVGRTPLANDYGTVPLYHVRRRQSAVEIESRLA